MRRIVGNDHDTEDVIQDVFTEAWRVFSVKNVENWSALLGTMARRRAIDLLRRRIRQATRTTGTVELNQLAEVVRDPAAALHAQERDEQLRAGLAQLSDREAEVFTLAYFEGLSKPEIAEMLDTTPNAVNVAISKAVQKLRGFLEKWSQESETGKETKT